MCDSETQRCVKFYPHSLGFMKEGIISIIELNGSLSHLKNAYLGTSLHIRY